MTTDTAVIEQALIAMAIAMGVQTLLFVAAAIGAFVAWRQATRAMEEARLAMQQEIVFLREHVNRISGTVDEVAGSVLRGTSAMGDVVSDVRDAMGTVGNSLHSVASVVTAPRAAVAIGLWRGLSALRKRRASSRAARRATAALAAEL
jgi:hypothetical protein